MNTIYRTVNHCLRELQDLELPQVRKLQIEIELLQAKRLLLIPRTRASAMAMEAIDFEGFQASFSSVGRQPDNSSADKLFALAKALHAALRQADTFSHR